MLIGATPLPDGLPLECVDQNRAVIEHVTELTILIALMGVGLALDRPLQRAVDGEAGTPGRCCSLPCH